MRRWLTGLVALGLFVGALTLGWAFRAGNSEQIALNLIWIHVTDVEIWRAIVVSLGFGALGAGILVGFAWLRLRLLNRRYRSTIRRLEAELHQLRSLPLASHADRTSEEP